MEEVDSLFHATVETQDGDPVVRIPRSEVRQGAINIGDTVQVGIFRREGQPKQGSHGDIPVSIGEERQVTIEGIGDQGDGIARTEEGFVIIVPDADVGDEVRVEITEVKDTVAFGKTVETQEQVL